MSSFRFDGQTKRRLDRLSGYPLVVFRLRVAFGFLVAARFVRAALD
jgi:hypothetical protein